MYNVLVVYQGLMVLACFFFVIIMTKQHETMLSKLMLCVGFLSAIQNAGYLLELLSGDLGQAMTAIRMEYLGGAFISTFLLIFVSQYCGFTVSKLLQHLMFFLDGFVLVCVWGCQYTRLFYTSTVFVSDCVVPHVELGKGPLYFLFYLVVGIQLTCSAVFTQRAYRLTRNGSGKVNLLALGICCIFPLFAFVSNLLQVVEGFDAVPGLGAFGILVFGIVVVFYHVFDISVIAHEEIIRTLDEAVLIVDNKGGYIEANNMAKERFAGLDCFQKGEMVSDGNPGDFLFQNRYFEYIFNNRTYEVHVNQLRNKRRLAGYAIVFLDITESRRQLKQTQLLKVNAEKANQAKSDFLARMSHEIRTPINAVLGMNEMILRESKEPEIRKYSMDIKSSAQTLMGIINDILDFSKIESGKMEIVPAEYEFNSLLNDLFNMISLRAEEKGLKLEILVDSDLPSLLYGDDIRLRQVLANLLTNAVKYTQKGKVTFSVSGEKQGDDVILHFSVRDTGIGIRDEDRDRLFNAFERLEEEVNRNVEGTGLGMNITIQLLKLMGAKLKVESVYGEGSCFSFSLRQGVRGTEAIGSFQERARKAARAHLYKASFLAPEADILLVDDNRVNRRVFIGLLKQTQIRIKDVKGGRECLEEVEKKHYDVIFLDHMMPEMDGMETLRQMKKMTNNLCEDTPIVMLTANAIVGAKEQYLAEGFDDFLAKPIEQEKLEKILMKWLPDKKIEKRLPGKE